MRLLDRSPPCTRSRTKPASGVESESDYASSPNQEHRPAWTAFNRAARKAPGAVGVWHETFRVDTAESVYVSTKPMGLPKATELVEVGRRQDRAQARFAEGRTEAAQ
ncbi:monooxygenase family protein [Microbacterium sp. NPDC055665]